MTKAQDAFLMFEKEMEDNGIWPALSEGGRGLMDRYEKYLRLLKEAIWEESK